MVEQILPDLLIKSSCSCEIIFRVFFACKHYRFNKISSIQKQKKVIAFFQNIIFYKKKSLKSLEKLYKRIDIFSSLFIYFFVKYFLNLYQRLSLQLLVNSYQFENSLNVWNFLCTNDFCSWKNTFFFKLKAFVPK